MTTKFRVLGAGVWGLAFSDYLLSLGHTVEIFRRDTSLEDKSIQQLGLKNVSSNHIKSLETLNDQKHDNEINVIAVNSKGFGDLLNNHENYFGRLTEVVSLTKGIDHQSGRLFSDLVSDRFTNIQKYGLISGPSFAKDLCDGKNIIVSIASLDDDLCSSMVDATKSSYFAMDPSNFIYHIEIAGVIKNIAAVLCGMADQYYGKGVYTDKIIKKACEEAWQTVLNLFDHLPADKFQNQVDYYTQHKDIIISSPGYIGDMILTCKQNQSRNYQFGKLIADEKISIEDAKDSIGTVEGYDCCKTIIEHPNVNGEDALTTLLYEILKSRNTEREQLIKEFL
tara:strand:+ start:381 stop:1391 length:1011 start_codon:yes stop_codon:yes gene_type:complete